MSARLRITLAAALAVFALTAAGCSAAAKAPELDGTSWVLTAWSVSSASATDFKTTVTFTDGTIGGQAAVNSYGGQYEVGSDGTLTTTEIVRTLMAGSDEANHAEDVYFELLEQAEKAAVEGDTLTLADTNGNELLVFTSAR